MQRRVAAQGFVAGPSIDTITFVRFLQAHFTRLEATAPWSAYTQQRMPARAALALLCAGSPMCPDWL